MREEINATGRNVPDSAVNPLSEEEIDLNLMGSFPASDPPSWTLGIARPNKPSISRPSAPED